MAPTVVVLEDTATVKGDLRNKTRRSILTLDKSEDPFQDQIFEACSILDIDLGSPAQGLEVFTDVSKIQQKDNPLAVPRYEWLLVWLLKKLRTEVHPGSPCLLPETWLLLRFLIAHTHPAKAAQLLLSNRFTDILGKSLDWLQKRPAASAASIVDYSSESSSGERWTARKRKRDGAEVYVYNQKSDTPEPISTLVLSICGCLLQLQYLVECQSKENQPFVAERLRHALSCAPEEAAGIFGSGLGLLNYAWRSTTRSQSSQQESAAEHTVGSLHCEIINPCVEIFIKFWETQLHSSRSGLDKPKVKAFTKRGLVSSLLLLQTCREGSTEDRSLQALATKMESLIATNVMVPLQNFFFDVGADSLSDLRNALTEVFHSSPLPHLSNQDCAQISNTNWTQQAKAEAYLLTTLMCSFFEIAVACCSGNTSKARREEDSFLRRLFNELKSCAEVQLGPQSPNSMPRAYTRALVHLLQKTINRRVQLELSTVESILEQGSGLFDNSGKKRVEWTLISLCLKNNADVFVIPAGAASGIYSYRKPNIFLTFLFEILEMENQNAHADYNQLYSLKLNGILIPLLRAFANARDLPGFLEHWKQQLHCHWKKVQLGSPNGLAEKTGWSLWEDEDFLQAAQELIEPSLSAAQLDTVLDPIQSGLESMNSNEDESSKSLELVILDCLFEGCHSEDLLTRLSARARSMYEILARATAQNSRVYESHKWRLWRILATLYRKWLTYEDGLTFIETTQEVANRAFAILDATGGEINEKPPHTYQNQSFAFGVMTALALSENVWNSASELFFREKLKKSVEIVLDLKEQVYHQPSEECFDVLSLQRLHCWNGKAHEIRSTYTLHLSCFAQLLTQPSILSCLDSSTRNRVLRQLIQLARYERSKAEFSLTDICYSWLWGHLQRCEALTEDTILSRTVRNLQWEHYMSVLRSQDAASWEIDSAEYAMAFEGVEHGPLLQFDTEHRIDIANKILDILVCKEDLDLKTTANHLQLLIKFADAPRKSGNFKKRSKIDQKKTAESMEKSMTIFQNIKMNNDLLQERPAVVVLAEVVFRKAWSVEKLDCDNALCRLTRIILRHMYATLGQSPASARYFTMFYQWIEAELESAKTVTPLCRQGFTSKSSMLLVTMTALNYYHENRKRLIEILGSQVTTTDHIRYQHFVRVVNRVDGGWYHWHDQEDRHELAATLECLYGYLELLELHPDMNSILYKLSDMLDDIQKIYDITPLEDRLQWSVYGNLAMRARHFQLRKMLMLSDESHYRDIIKILKEIETVSQGRKKDSLRRCFHEMMQDSSISTIKYALHIIDSEKLESRWGELALLNAMLCNLRKEEVEALHSESSSILFLLCRKLLASLDFRSCMTSMHCIDVLLHKFQHIISQHHVDTLFSSITTTTYSFASNDNSSHVAKLYIGLCRLFVTILTLHRTKLGGRYHLLLPALQALLRPLFVPHTAVPILAEPASAFNQTQATAYARLLTTLCDPSPSAVGRLGKSQPVTLNDERKRAKRVAGQHLHYLIMTYCECQLEGRLAAEGMREAMEPGLWAVMECIGPEVMRTINTGIDASGKAVWKRLYEDWKKYGRWQSA